MSQETKVNAGGGIDLWVRKDPVKTARAVVIIVHGICEHSGRYDHVAAFLNGFGCSVYRFDHRGHGLSGGQRGYVDRYGDFVDDADRIVSIAKEDFPDIPAFMLGHSMGGFVTALYGIEHPDRLAGQILSGAAVTLSPLLQGMEDFDYNATPLAPIPNSLSDLVCRDPEVVKAYMEDPLTLKEFTTKLMGEVLITGVKKLVSEMGRYAYPCLILHGGADQIVSPDASRYFYDHIASKDKQIKIYDGLYHEILNEPEKQMVMNDIRAWLEPRI